MKKTKDQFLSELRTAVDQFSSWWDKIVDEVIAETSADLADAVRHAHQRMTSADWFEQFLIFCENEDTEIEGP